MSNETMYAKARQAFNDGHSTGVTNKQKAEILRDIWIAHDGRWFIKTASEQGFDVATKLNLAVQKSFGKTEMKRLRREFGGVEIKNIDDLHRFLVIASDVYCPVEHKYEYNVIDENNLSVKILQCYVHFNVSLAGTTKIHKCAGKTRFEAWLKGLGLDGEIINPAETATCGGQCEFIFKINR